MMNKNYDNLAQAVFAVINPKGHLNHYANECTPECQEIRKCLREYEIEKVLKRVLHENMQLESPDNLDDGSLCFSITDETRLQIVKIINNYFE